MHDTPLGYTVQIRAETDVKKIREMTAHEKKIRSDWQRFKNAKQANNTRRAEDAGMAAFAAFAKSAWGVK